MSRRFGVFIVVFAFFTILLNRIRISYHPKEIDRNISQAPLSVADAAQKKQDIIVIVKHASEPAKKTQEMKAAAWKAFRDRYGNDLQAEFTNEGRLINIRGGIQEGHLAGSGFRISDTQAVVTRAREILSAARDLLEIETDWPLGKPAAKMSAVSAQVYFNQTHDGIALAPLGAVTIDLGAQGELLGLYSDYVPHLQIENEFKIEPSIARLKALAVLPQQYLSALRSDEGNKVIWVRKNQAYLAYEFQTRGYQIIIDAGSGSVLFTGDQRYY